MDELTAHSAKPEDPGWFACKTGACLATSACLTACTTVARNSGEGWLGVAETTEVELFAPTTADWENWPGEKPIKPRELAVK